MLLFLLLFFGIGFLLNMILRSTWVMAIVYPLVVIFIIDDVSIWDYIGSPGSSFRALGNHFVALQLVDILILSSGLVGAIAAGIAIRMLRVRGYQMF
ncbi:YuiB family protein [Bacillus piscicola]|uniref:YuiB family protein n=1 Tax=Bacillus piscicola TaxID=1632684 RepID=UPI001F088E18